MNSPEAVYSACQCCTAKWFGPRELGFCPRGGADEVLHALAVPSWTGQTNQRFQAQPKEIDAQNSRTERSTLLTRPEEVSMKLIERERVDGTQVTIGRRIHYENGRQRTGRRYAAEYRDDEGEQVCETLRTSNKSQARRLAVEIQQRLDNGMDKAPETTITVDDLADRYFDAVKTKDVAPKTEWKYRADLAKLKEFSKEVGITLARRFSADDLFRFRQWLIKKDYAAKTVEAVLVLTKQVFKWGWRQTILRDYRLAAVSLPKAKAKPQPCFTTAQVESLIGVAEAEEKTAFAMMGYAGLRIGEVEQLRWEDIRHRDGKPAMLHIRRGGSAGTTKDKGERFVPIHPRIAELLAESRKSGRVFEGISERVLLARLKDLCETCKFEKPREFKLHSFRHHFASLCANHGVAHRKALAWLGHSSSDMLDLYYHLHDDDSQQAMLALAGGNGTVINRDPGAEKRKESGENAREINETDLSSEGSLRAVGQSTIEKLLQLREFQELVNCLGNETEREGFEPPQQLPADRISNAAPSATRTPLQGSGNPSKAASLPQVRVPVAPAIGSNRPQGYDGQPATDRARTSASHTPVGLSTP